MKRSCFMLFFILFWFAGCENMDYLPGTVDGTVGLSSYTVDKDGGVISVVVTSATKVNISNKPAWIEEVSESVTNNHYIYSFSMGPNISLTERTGVIEFSPGSKTPSVSVVQNPYSAYKASDDLTGLVPVTKKMELEDDTFPEIGGGTVTAKGKTDDPRNGKHANTNSPFPRLYDGERANNQVFYSHQHSVTGNPDPQLPQPVRLDFYVPQNNRKFDHLDYYANYNNSLGAWGEVELYVSTDAAHRQDADETNFTKVGEMDCGFPWTGGTSFKTEIPAARFIEGIRILRVLVKSSMHNGSVICVGAIEVELFGQEPLAFSPSDLFTDNSCSVLKDGIDQGDIADYEYPMFQKLAEYLYLGLYPSERIINMAGPSAPPVRTAVQTGGQLMVVMLECAELDGVEVDIVDSGDNVLKTYPLSNGDNLLRNVPEGAVQVRYSGSTAAKLNILTGTLTE